MPQKKPRNYAANKKAFDEVMQYYRDTHDVGLGAMSYEHVGMGGTPNRAKPTPTDFRSDVELVIYPLLAKKRIPFYRFIAAYILWDSEDPIENEMHAHKLLGDRRHSIEQRMGEEFRNRDIFPVRGGKGYFHVLRKKVCSQ
jgi:hypothetical protein